MISLLASLLAALLPNVTQAAVSAKKTPVKYVDMKNVANTEDFIFKPVKLSVKAGTKVVWRNKSDQPHQVTAHGSHPAFNSGTAKFIDPGKSWSHVFKKPGTFRYYCPLHQGMEATLTVKKK